MKKLIDTRIDAASSLTAFHDVIKGGANIASQEFKAISASSSNVDFVIQTPGLGVYMSRRVNIQTRLSIDVSVNNSGLQRIIRWGKDFGLSAFPLNSLVTNATVQINTSNFNTQVGQNMPLWKRLYQNDKLRAALPEVPTGLGHTAIAYAGDNTAMPQSQIKAGSWPDNVPSNTSTYDVTFVSGANATATLDGTITLAAASACVFTVLIDVVEPLLIQPFSTDDEEPAFINVNVMTVRLNLCPPRDQQARPIRFAFAPTAATGTDDLSDLQFTDQVMTPTTSASLMLASTLRCQFITPPATDQIPTKTIYPTMYYNPLSTRITGLTIPSGQVSTLQSSNVITLNTAPDMIAIYAVPDFSSLTSATQDGLAGAGGSAGALMEDLMLSIESLQIQWNNNPSLLATFNKQDLYRRTRENGLDLPWYMFNGNVSDVDATATAVQARTLFDVPKRRATIGAPVLLALNKDIPVEPGVGAGVAGVYTLSVKATFKNQFPFTFSAFTFFVVPINSQYLVLNSGATSDVISTIATEQVVAAAPVSGELQSKALLGQGRRTMHTPGMASYRRGHAMGRTMESGSRSGGPGGGAGAAQYVGTKRANYG